MKKKKKWKPLLLQNRKTCTWSLHKSCQTRHFFLSQVLCSIFIIKWCPKIFLLQHAVYFPLQVKIWFQNRRARERRERESNIQPSGAQRSLGQQPPASSRQDAQQLASELCAQRLGQGAPIHPMSPAEAAAAAALGPSAMGPMGINWPPLAIPPNPALIAHISHSLGSSSAFRPVSFPT